MKLSLVLGIPLVSLAVLGCHHDDAAPATGGVAPTASAQGGGGTPVTPDVGAVTPVTSTSLDDAAGGGVNSSMMKKAKGVAAEGVGSVNNAQKQGSYGTDDGG